MTKTEVQDIIIRGHSGYQTLADMMNQKDNEILAWLGYWRDSFLSDEAVTQLQDILGVPK